ncbi:MAG: rRNA maturation RNase YbeY [Anaerolineales bacterium]|jgi:probable rRNA maturation factor
MTYQVQIVHEHSCEEETGNLEAVAISVLEHENAPPGALSVVLTSDERIREMNHRFARIDRATDVLAFSDGSRDPETGQIYFGDVTIALPIARQQAKRANQTLAAELTLLTIHGVLHLLGHDHRDEDEKNRMWRTQAEILRKFGHSFEPSELET